MRILYVTPAFHHPTLRGPTRCYHFIKELGRRHAITLLSLSKVEVSREAHQEMASYTERILLFDTRRAPDSRWRGLLEKLPFVGRRLGKDLRRRDAIQRMKEAFDELVRKDSYDVVLFHGKLTLPVIEDFDALPLVVDFCDAGSLGTKTRLRHARVSELPFVLLRHLQMRRIESRLVRKSPHLAFISQRDREVILGPGSRAEVVSIGVDLGFWSRRAAPASSHSILFSGIMNYAPNEDAALHLIDRILPRVQQSIPDAGLLVVGRDPTPALLERSRLRPGVTVTGFVDDLRPYLERAAVCAAPLRFGAGVQNKVLEAMAMGVPVVTTSIAAAGLRVDDAAAPPLYVADDDERFAACLVQLLQDPGERARLAREGRRFVEEHFVWAHQAERLEALCQEAVRERHGKPEDLEKAG
jgi:glycosyltransferase involved in cell wall biosynthesis